MTYFIVGLIGEVSLGYEACRSNVLELLEEKGEE